MDTFCDVSDGAEGRSWVLRKGYGRQEVCYPHEWGPQDPLVPPVPTLRCSQGSWAEKRQILFLARLISSQISARDIPPEILQFLRHINVSMEANSDITCSIANTEILWEHREGETANHSSPLSERCNFKDKILGVKTLWKDKLIQVNPGEPKWSVAATAAPSREADARQDHRLRNNTHPWHLWFISWVSW